MDIAKFSETEFDCRNWINDTFKSSDSSVNREQLANNLVMKLQLYIQEVNKNLEDTSQQIVHNMPRIVRELESMQQEAVLFANRMKSVQQDVHKVEHNTATAMQSLLHIDSVKARVQAVEMALSEIDKWTALTQDMDSVFASGDIEAMTTRLTQLQTSLSVLGPKSPDYNERRDYLQSVKDQFISVISPSVVTAFTSQSAEQVSYFCEMFVKLERQDDLDDYYHKCLKVDLCKVWKEMLSVEDDVTTLFTNFYDHLLTTWFAQVKWAGECLPEPAKKVCRGLSTALSNLDPALISTLTDALDSSDQKLAALDAIKTGTENFCRSIESSFEQFSLQGSVQESEFFVEIFRPISHFVTNYREYQQSALVTFLNAYSFQQKDLREGVKQVSASVDPVFKQAFNALDKCLSLTNGLSFPMLVKALQSYFTNYVSKLKKVLSPIKAQLKAEAELPEEGSMFHKENWDMVNTLLNLSKATGSIFMELDRLDEGLLVGFNRMCDAASAAGITGVVNNCASEIKQSGSADILNKLVVSDVKLTNAIHQLMLKNEGDSFPKFLHDIEKQLLSVNNQVLKLTSEQLLGPVSKDIQAIPKLGCWSAGTVGEALTQDLPAFSLSPQEYITKVGQYMMTLAHQLEPYLSSDDPQLCVSLTRGTLTYVTESVASEHAVQLWLQVVGEGIMHRYTQAATSITYVSPCGAKQLVADIEYLCNVLEDLGLGPSEPLASLKTLMKMDYEALSRDTTHPQNIVAAVKEIRKKRT